MTRKSSKRETLFMEGLEREWEAKKGQLQGKTLETIYFGGGTPSQLDPSNINNILSWLNPMPEAEITLEANPDDITPEYARVLKTIGINRVSLGIQTLSDPLLTAIGRTHCANKGPEAVERLAAAGITNISIDLMLELPGQTLSDVRRTLHVIDQLPITHVSLYNLVLEPPSLFYKRRKQVEAQMPTESTSLAMLQETCRHLQQLGLMRYEISAFARPGYEARHNTGYWTGRPFLGLGPSAFSYWEGSRFRNIANLEAYAARLAQGGSPVDFHETLPPERRWRELLAISLRLIQGVDLGTFTQNHGPKPVNLNLSPLLDDGLLIQRGYHLTLTAKGRLFYDTVASELVM